MADLLDPDKAVLIARRLKVIKGVPWDEESLWAIGQCLSRWCVGFIEGAQVWTPEHQASACVSELVARCAEDGTEWQGIGQLRDVFNERFKRAEPPGPSQEEQWRKQYGPPDKAWVEKLVAAAGVSKNFQTQFHEHHLQAIRDAIYYTEGKGRFELEPRHGDGEQRKREKRQSQQFWASAMEHHNREHSAMVASVRAESVPEGDIQ